MTGAEIIHKINNPKDDLDILVTIKGDYEKLIRSGNIEEVMHVFNGVMEMHDDLSIGALYALFKSSAPLHSQGAVNMRYETLIEIILIKADKANYPPEFREQLMEFYYNIK